MKIKKQAGQIILILVLVMTAALAVGLAVVQRSLTDVSTSTKVEQSSRAFSAAEAGIERALRTKLPVGQESLGNDSSIKQVDVSRVPTGNRPYEPSPDGLKKEDFAQVWLARPDASDSDNSPTAYYGSGIANPSLDIYWGDGGMTSDYPAIEVSILYRFSNVPQTSCDYITNCVYGSHSYFYDSDPGNRINSNHFADPRPCLSPHLVTDLNPDRAFYCRVTISNLGSLIGTNGKLIMVRAHLLYNNSPHGFAVGPTTGSLPPQGRLLISTGTSGDVSRTVRVLSTDKVLPIFFDYAIFSLGDIRK